MLKRLTIVIAVVAMASLLISASLASAAGGTGPWDAYAVDTAWHQIDPGQAQWYAFKYDGNDEQLLIKLDADPDDGAMFMVRTPEQARVWQETGDEKACGCSSNEESVKADQSWSGKFNIPGIYYVVVKHSGHHATPVYYSLSVNGKGVSVPSAAKPSAAAPEPAVPVSSESAAMSSFEDWMAMEGGTTHWESFRYDKSGSAVEIIMDAEPNNAVTFSVWTPDQVRRYSLGEDVEPVGRGTVNEEAPGDVSWAGKFASPGTYYVRVEHLGPGMSYCKLTLKGDNAWY